MYAYARELTQSAHCKYKCSLSIPIKNNPLHTYAFVSIQRVGTIRYETKYKDILTVMESVHIYVKNALQNTYRDFHRAMLLV